MTTPKRPEHADRDYRIPGADPRLTIRRHLTGYAYSLTSQANDRTPIYRWLLLADGRVVDNYCRKRELVEAARTNGAAYLAAVESGSGVSAVTK